MLGVVALIMVAATLVSAPLSAQAAIAAPRSLSPAGGAQSAIPTLQWSRVSAAVRYDVQVSTSSGFSTTLASTSTTNRRYTPSVQLPAARIYWRVRSVNSSGSSSGWAKTSFSRTRSAGPTLQSPADGASLAQPADPPVLSWSPVANASGYEVMIDNDNDFIDATTATTSTTSHLVPNPQPATTFWWKVRAVRGSGLNTDWSTVRSYTIGALPEVVPSSPDEQAAVEDIVFDWPAVAGAKDYELRVSTDRDFNTLVGGREIVVKSTRYSPPVTVNNDEYWWQVRARDNAGNSIPWSDETRVLVRHFQRHWPDQPKLEYPATDARVGDPMFFEWSPVDHASRYQLDMSSDPNFSPNTITTCYTDATTLTPGVTAPYDQANGNCTPQPGKVQYWRVRALDEPFPGGGVNGIWSDIQAFTYDPGMVTPVAPANGSTVSVPTLRWDAARDAERYHIEITNNAGSVVARTDTYALSWTPNVKLDPAKSPYRWTVTSIDSNGHSSPSVMFGDQWQFSVDGASPTTGSAPLTPLSGNTTTARFPAIRWEPYPNATHYKVFIGPAGGTVTQVASNHHYPVFTDASKNSLATRSYDWVVEAWNGTSYLGTSPLGQFTITDLPPVTGQRLALTGTSVESNSCNRKLSDAGVNFCDNLRQTPVLDWNPTPEASHYLVYLFNDEELTNGVYPYDYVTTQNTRWSPSKLLPDSQAGDAYFWFVRPCKALNVCAPDPIEATHSFDKESRQIQLATPVDGARVLDELELSWKDNLEVLQVPIEGQQLKEGAPATNATVEAEQYRVQISDDRSFAKVLKTETVDQTTYTPYAQTFPEGPLYWRVQAIDGSGNSLTWSETRTINKQSDPVNQVAPATSSTVSSTPFFQWQPQDFAAGYTLEVYDDNDTTMSLSNRVINITTKQAAYTHATPLPTSSANYLWRVRRLDADNKPGQWSPLRSFTVSGLAPGLSYPKSSSFVQGNDSSFSWRSVAGASTYRFEARMDGQSYSSQNVTTHALSWAPTSTLYDGRWEWRVSSLDSRGQTIANTGWRTFYVDSTRPSVRRRLPGNGPSRYANWSATFSEPVRRVNSTTMRLYRAGRRDPVSARITSSNGGRTWTLNPSSRMSRRVKYTLKLSSGITDRAANASPKTSYSRTVR